MSDFSRAERFDADSVRHEWDHAADAYASGQTNGRDYYRFEFFGPEHTRLCGSVDGLRILDLGCGSGYFAREMAMRGAKVTGVDISPRMIEHAVRTESAEPLGIDYHVCDAARIDDVADTAAFDMVTSCLALQDMPDIPGVLAQVRRVLKAEGRLVASITHPCSDTPFRVWERDEAGGKKWLCIDRYFDRGPLRYAWKGWAYEFTTASMHATLADWFAWFGDAGLVLEKLEEPQPTAEALEKRPDLEDAARVPYYLMVSLRRSTDQARRDPS